MGNYLCFCKNYYISSDLNLDNLNYGDVDYFSLDNMEFTAKVVDVYDGDTCSVIFKLSNEYVKFKCRCLGYDSPEMKPRLNTPNREQEIQAAKKAKEYIEELVLNKNVLVEFSKYDKYGRPLCKLYINKCVFCSKIKLCVNDLMIEKGYGYEYNGGKKKSFK